MDQTYQEGLRRISKSGGGVRTVEEEDSLTTYLLDAMPFLQRHAHALEYNDYEECERITIEFQQKMKLEPPCSQRARTIKEKALTIDLNICEICNSRNLAMLPETASTVCMECGHTSSFGILDGIKSLNYNQRMALPPSVYTYNPEKHFDKLLNQAEGICTRTIPLKLLDILEEKFRQHRFPKNRITPLDVRTVLKSVEVFGAKGFKGRKFYSDVFYLAHKLNPAFTPSHISDKRRRIFQGQFRLVFSKFHETTKKIKSDRKNFLSYPFIAYKFSELNGWKEYIPLFGLLKSRDKLRSQDVILRHIFDELDWPWKDTI